MAYVFDFPFSASNLLETLTGSYGYADRMAKGHFISVVYLG